MEPASNLRVNSSEQPPSAPFVCVLTVGNELPDIEKMAALMNDLRRMRHLQIILVPRGLPMPKPNWAKQNKTGIMHALEILCIGTEKIEGRLSRRTFPGRPVKKNLEVILTTHTVSSPSTNGAITEASPLSPSV